MVKEELKAPWLKISVTRQVTVVRPRKKITTEAVEKKRPRVNLGNEMAWNLFEDEKRPNSPTPKYNHWSETFPYPKEALRYAWDWENEMRDGKSVSIEIETSAWKTQIPRLKVRETHHSVDELSSRFSTT